MTDLLNNSEGETMTENKPIAGDVTPTDLLINDFSKALKEKLNYARIKYGWHEEQWKNPDNIEGMRSDLYRHLEKGDPKDVAAYCAFLWFHLASTAKTIDTIGTETKEAIEWARKMLSDIRITNKEAGFVKNLITAAQEAEGLKIENQRLKQLLEVREKTS